MKKVLAVLYRERIREKGDYSASVSGKFRYEAESPSDYPAVGDFVLLQCVNKNDIAVIQKVLPRKSVFLRKAAGTNSVEQIVAANIDTVLSVCHLITILTSGDWKDIYLLHGTVELCLSLC